MLTINLTKQCILFVLGLGMGMDWTPCMTIVVARVYYFWSRVAVLEAVHFDHLGILLLLLLNCRFSNTVILKGFILFLPFSVFDKLFSYFVEKILFLF